MKEVIRSLDDTSLTQSEKRQGKFELVGKLTDVGNSPINPGIFLISEVYVMEIVLDKTRIFEL